MTHPDKDQRLFSSSKDGGLLLTTFSTSERLEQIQILFRLMIHNSSDDRSKRSRIYSVNHFAVLNWSHLDEGTADGKQEHVMKKQKQVQYLNYPPSLKSHNTRRSSLSHFGLVTRVKDPLKTCCLCVQSKNLHKLKAFSKQKGVKQKKENADT